MSTGTREMMENAHSFVKQIQDVLPPELGVIIIIYNRTNGHGVFKAPNLSRKSADILFKSFIAKDQSSPIIIPSGRLT